MKYNFKEDNLKNYGRDNLSQWKAWLTESDQLAKEILNRRQGEPLDVDVLWQAARTDLEARDNQLFAYGINNLR